MPDRAKWQLTLVSDTVNMATAGNFIEWRKAARDFLLRILEYAYEELLKRRKVERRWWQRLFARSKDEGIEKEKQDILDTYWFYRAVKMREEGKLPAWESIVLVREDKE